jgi:hypothetical protein
MGPFLAARGPNSALENRRAYRFLPPNIKGLSKLGATAPSPGSTQTASGLPILAIERDTRQLLERDLGEASEFARMQALPFLGLELFRRLQADLEMLADALAAAW